MTEYRVPNGTKFQKFKENHHVEGQVMACYTFQAVRES